MPLKHYILTAETDGIFRDQAMNHLPLTLFKASPTIFGSNRTVELTLDGI